MILQPTSEHLFTSGCVIVTEITYWLFPLYLQECGTWHKDNILLFVDDIHMQKGKHITSDYDFLSTRHLSFALLLIDAEGVAKPRCILYSVEEHKETLVILSRGFCGTSSSPAAHRCPGQ